jgi:hypothetical protein
MINLSASGLGRSLIPGARWLYQRRMLRRLASSGRQRSDLMSFQTSIISFVLPPCLIAIPLALEAHPRRLTSRAKFFL